MIARAVGYSEHAELLAFKNSSMTTFRPASLNALPLSISSCLNGFLEEVMTAFACGEPSAFKT